MFEMITNAVLAVVVLVVVQAEVYAMLQAAAYARKIDGSMAHKFRVWNARYDWSSILFHEAGTERPAYSVTVTLAIGLLSFLGILATMHDGKVPLNGHMALLGGMLTSIGFFVGSYGAAFKAHREYVAFHQQHGTWQIT